MTPPPLLDVRALRVSVNGRDGARLPILADISFTLGKGETLGIVGESGSGKSMLALALIGLLPGGAEADGEALLEGTDLLRASERELCALRGRRIGMIFQEPMTALNPSMRVGDQIAEGLVRGRGLSRREARARALALLDRVRIPDAARRLDAFPHEMSGGQRQRVGIAIALALEPALLIADEPTTALDVTVQAEILDILAELVRESAMAMIFVSHDLGVVARATERVLVLYAGARLEEGRTREVLEAPRNPYTRGLLAAMPRRPSPGAGGAGRLATIPGTVPGFSALPPGCRFAPRCAFRLPPCEAREPAWEALGEGRGLRCIRGGAAGDLP
ncbi:ABC transporter ATP-binding protein [Aurantimonas sp. Leaf443]|uniref:ABC transporter ATP-binding protein n=1 Tax=Aurantimonas sp. Leaf443 TaxID=1736378 RepID=UPI0006FA598C|nr:ABC transporter ATP-binding protein [Aurantimonas sp. Leaf443]KQT85752.1 peptide ABC transporter ATP-binding protein [Aurantimonas sp. Leaf443]